MEYRRGWAAIIRVDENKPVAPGQESREKNSTESSDVALETSFFLRGFYINREKGYPD